MKYGYFDDSSREYVITTPKTLCHGLITLAVRISSLLSPTQVAAIASIRMQSCCDLHVIATIMFLLMMAVIIST